MTAPLERQVLDAIPVMIYAVDLQGRITYLNRPWLRFAQQNGAPQLGDARAVVGASLWDSISDDAAKDQIRRAMTTLSEGRAPSLSWEVPVTTSTGERTFLVQLGAIGDAHAVTGYAFSTVDITAIRRAGELRVETSRDLALAVTIERVLTEASQLLLRTMLCDSVAIALETAPGGELRLAHHSGVSSDNVTEIAGYLAPAWEDARRSRDVVGRSHGEGTQLTAPMVHGENVVGAITVSTAGSTAPHLVEGVRRLLATVAEESAVAIERALLIRHLEHKRRLEAIGEVTAGVAHELRNPLFGISSAAQLLRFRVKDDPIVEKNLGRILREVERLNSIVTSLLEYGSPAPVNLQPGDPETVWDAVIERHRGRLESKALLLHRRRSPEPTSCDIDVEHLAQVFSNVLMNAIEAAPDGSDLTLESNRLMSGNWRCRLMNGGPPIPPDVLPRVFEIFFSTKAGGTGIGLPLCQRIMEDHHGTISLESAPDVGTAVTIILPPAG
jgi:signal transduction histidine kinase